jgi:hypothetical protein
MKYILNDFEQFVQHRAAAAGDPVGPRALPKETP